MAVAEPTVGRPKAPARAVPASERKSVRLRRSRRRWLVWLAIVVVLVVGGRFAVARRTAKPIPVRVHQVSRGPVRDLVTSVTTGRVGARREVVIRAEVAGTVKTLHHRRGDVVPAGAPLVSFDPEELRDRARTSDAAVKLADAQALQAEAALHAAESSASRARALASSGAIPSAQADDADDQADVARKAATAARAAASQARAGLDLARFALSKSVVRAPFAGTVITTGIEEGDVTVPGVQLVSFADVSQLFAEADVDEADVGRVRVGMPADVTFDAFADERFAAKVTEIAPSVTRDLRGSRSVTVRVDLPSDPRLRLGMSADLEIVVDTRDDVVSVPPSAVVGRGAERAVYVVEGGVARKRPVEVGISTWEAVEVKRGLGPGEKVVLSLTKGGLEDGTKVEVAP